MKVYQITEEQFKSILTNLKCKKETIDGFGKIFPDCRCEEKDKEIERLKSDLIDGNEVLFQCTNKRQEQEEELLRLREFVGIMVKEEATTLSNAKSLLGFTSMEEAREWYEALQSKEECEHKRDCGLNFGSFCTCNKPIKED